MALVEAQSAIIALVISLIISFLFLVYFNKIILWKNGFGNDENKIRGKSIISKAFWQGGWLIMISFASNLLTFGILAIDIFKTHKTIHEVEDEWSSMDLKGLWRIFFYLNMIINV